MDGAPVTVKMAELACLILVVSSATVAPDSAERAVASVCSR